MDAVGILRPLLFLWLPQRLPLSPRVARRSLAIRPRLPAYGVHLRGFNVCSLLAIARRSRFRLPTSILTPRSLVPYT